MEGFTAFFSRLILGLVIASLLVVRPVVYGQMTTLCTSSMLRSFTPCINFANRGGGNGNSSPTSDCCDSLKSLMSSGRDCLCLIITGGVPFRVPINRTIAASLPRACNKDGVPIECKAMGSPLPAPGPSAGESGGPPQGSNNPQTPWLPEPNVTTPPGGSDDGDDGGSAFTPPDVNQFPMTPPGIRPALSSAQSSYKGLSPRLLLLLALFYGVIVAFASN